MHRQAYTYNSMHTQTIVSVSHQSNIQAYTAVVHRLLVCVPKMSAQTVEWNCCKKCTGPSKKAPPAVNDEDYN